MKTEDTGPREHIRVPADPRPAACRAPSLLARRLLFDLQARGLRIDLRDDGHLLVRPFERITAADRRAIAAAFHELRDLLGERPA